MSDNVIKPGSYEHKFDGIRRIYGKQNQALLKNLHVAVVGIGGVGSWTVEAFARSGLGEITIIDWDDVCYSNTNRQIHALDKNIGKSKVDVLKERVFEINSSCKVNAIREYYTAENANHIISNDLDYVIDAIDKKNQKIHLINHCKKINIPIITCGGAGGKTDPSQIKIADLGESYNDPLLFQMRKQLRRDLGLEKDVKVNFNVPCVFSAESMLYPDCEGNVSTEKIKGSEKPRQLDCSQGFGSTTYVTGCFGFFIASYVINNLFKK